MKPLAAALLLVLLGCGGVQVESPSDSPETLTPIDVRYALQIFSAYGFASACAVDRYVLTARHVIKPFASIPFLHDVMVHYTWSDGDGREGLFQSLVTSDYRDLGILDPINMTPVYQQLAVVPPQEGDTVRWVEYNKSGDDGDFFAPVEKSALVIRTVAGYVTFDVPPTNGASGTCLFDKSGDVVGVVVWAFPGTGLATLIVGNWVLE
jgi:hypothetical protein